MNSEHDLTTESQLASGERFDPDLGTPHAPPDATPPPGFGGHGGHGILRHSTSEIKVGKHTTLLSGKEVEVFTMTMGTETIELLPLRNWGQLDLYKWRVRGKLPGTPAGLEITADHVKLLGETVLPKDPEGCAKLERLFADWLAMEKESLELAKKKVQPKAVAVATEAELPPEERAMHFRVELDKEDQVHIHCVKGKETLAIIGLNLPGFHSLVSQGFMRKPHVLKTGALHDWVELDGVLYSFEKGNNDADKLAAALNASYLPALTLGTGKEVVVFANAASSTGFDIQFPAKVGGMVDNRRRPLGEDSLELLQDPDHCGLLHKGLVIKLTRPTLIFKLKTPEGSERYLDRCAENLVRVRDEDGEEKVIDLSQPVNYMHLSAVELTAVFNHPTINRHTQAAPPPSAAAGVQRTENKPAAISHPLSTPKPAQPAAAPTEAPKAQAPAASRTAGSQPSREPGRDPGESRPPEPLSAKEGRGGPPAGAGSEAQNAKTPSGKSLPQAAHPGTAGDSVTTAAPLSERKPPPNLWLRPILEQQPIRFDWFTCLVYGKIAARFHNSQEGQGMGGACWFISLGEARDLAAPDFTGLILTDQGGFGFLSRGYMARFENGKVSIGTQESALQGAEVRLLALGIDIDGRFVFIVNDGYRLRFGVPVQSVVAALDGLRARGATLMGVKEALETPEPLEVVWTVPVDQANPADPQAHENTRPGAVE